MNIDACRAISWSLAGIVLIALVACAPEYSERASVKLELNGKTSAEVNARSEFENSDLLAYQYLVVTVQVTKTSATPISASLVRGPQKASSAIDDLRVRALANSRLVLEYAVPDPRFRKRQRNTNRKRQRNTNTPAAGEWIELPSAEMKIYVPLSSGIRSVEIMPSPGRGIIVSSGGIFDPAPWAKSACALADPVTFPACKPVMALVIP